MYQTLYFNKHNTCNLRKLLSLQQLFRSWATYVEYYSYSLNNGLDRTWESCFSTMPPSPLPCTLFWM